MRLLLSIIAYLAMCATFLILVADTTPDLWQAAAFIASCMAFFWAGGIFKPHTP